MNRDIPKTYSILHLSCGFFRDHFEIKQSIKTLGHGRRGRNILDSNDMSRYIDAGLHGTFKIDGNNILDIKILLQDIGMLRRFGTDTRQTTLERIQFTQ